MRWIFDEQISSINKYSIHLYFIVLLKPCKCFILLQTFDHEGFHRQEHIWALENAADVLKFIDVFDEQNQRDMIENVLNKFQSSVLSQKDLLEKSIKNVYILYKTPSEDV